MVWALEERPEPLRFLLPDNAGKFTAAFDTIFASERIEVIHTPYRALNANAYAERRVRTVREECLDKLLILNEAHLLEVMREHVAYYNNARPHQGLEQRIPIASSFRATHGPIRCRDVLSGLIHDYYREAA
jgi:putative transposase